MAQRISDAEVNRILEETDKTLEVLRLRQQLAKRKDRVARDAVLVVSLYLEFTKGEPPEKVMGWLNRALELARRTLKS